jgi:hypothetical protein
MAAKVDKTFDMQGPAPHGHTLTVTASDFEKLLAGKEIMLRSSFGDDHSHAVVLHYTIKKP